MARKPQTVTPAASPYLAQLQAIQAALTGGLYMTQAEGNDIVAAGLAAVDTANTTTDDNGVVRAFVTLTAAGVAAAGLKADAAPVAPTAKPTFTVRADIPIPTKTRKAKEAVYPIDGLEIGQSFHVTKTDANPDPAARLQSTAANYRQKYMVEVKDAEGNTVTKTVQRKVYERNAEDKIVVGADGHRVVTGTETVTIAKIELGRDFVVAAVDASDPESVGARIWRTK